MKRGTALNLPQLNRLKTKPAKRTISGANRVSGPGVFTHLNRVKFTNYIDSNPNYFRVAGKPVIFFWGPQDMKRGSHLAPPGEVIALLEQVAVAHGDATPYLVATGMSESEVALAESWGFDAFSGYVWEPGQPSYADIIATYGSGPGAWGKWGAVKDQIEAYAPSLTFFVPTVAGQDGRPWNKPDRGEPTSSQFADHLEHGELFADTYSSRTGKNIILCCWNEWGEGEYIQPTVEKGTMLIDAYRSTVNWPPIRY